MAIKIRKVEDDLYFVSASPQMLMKSGLLPSR